MVIKFSNGSIGVASCGCEVYKNDGVIKFAVLHQNWCALMKGQSARIDFFDHYEYNTVLELS
mgnify:CR=1 FL=1